MAGLLEILFIISSLGLIVMWGWFVRLGFQANRSWGCSILFLFPISPFAFAYRFERKTRKIIYYFILSLLFFAGVTAYAIAFRPDFFPNLAHKLVSLAPTFPTKSSPEPVAVKPIEQPKPVAETEVIAEPTPEVIAPIVPAVEEKRHFARQKHYEEISLTSLADYIGKKVRLTTANVVHEGRLISISGGQVEIKKGGGGASATLPISKSKISKAEVYL